MPAAWSKFLNTFSKYRAAANFVGGIIAGAVISLATLQLSGLSLVSQHDLDGQSRLIAELQQENYELTDDLFRFQGPDAIFDPTELPYQETADAGVIVAAAREQAVADGKFLMITFGANWCLDCRTLHHHLQGAELKEYTEGLVDFVNVDVGKFNNNLDVAVDLGIDLRRGVPVAVFFDPEGRAIGTTNDGQLEPARYYSSKQILKFVRDIVEKSLIAAPDSIH